MKGTRKQWRLVGYDAFSAEWYPLRGVYATESLVLAAAERRLSALRKSQPDSSSGGQGIGGIQDRVFIKRPDGTMYRYTGQTQQKRRSRSRGFTLIELLIVMAIIGIIAAIAIPSLMRAKTPEQAYVKCNPQPRGSGVWYFTCGAQDFSLAMAKFISDNPGVLIISVSPASNENGQYAATIITRPAPRLPAEQP